MSDISKLKAKIEGVEQMIQTHKENYALSETLFSSLTIGSLQSQLEQLQEELYQENRKRDKEIVILHLTGHQADYGSLPLLTVSDITEVLAKGIFHVSKFIQYGNTNPKDSNKIIQETIDLRLYDVQRGSTKLMISGSTSPDLFGSSILQESLDSIIDLLNSDNQERVLEHIKNVGPDSIPHIASLLKTLNENSLEANLIWDSPSMDLEVWDGNRNNILKLYNTLTAIESPEIETKSYVGEVITVSIRRKLEIQTESGLIKISVPKGLKEVIKDFNVGGYVSCKVDVVKSVISSTGKEIIDLILNTIEEKMPPNTV